MVDLQRHSRFYALITSFVLLSTLTEGRRQQVKRHADHEAVVIPGWTVPLEGVETCTTSGYCTDALPAPPSTSVLRYLAVGRGTVTYSCAGRSSTETPLYTTQTAFLYDASTIISKFSSEDQFHSYIPRFLDYDYTSLDNSSMPCIGNIQRTDNLTIFDLYKVDAFAVTVRDVVNSPNDTSFDLTWAHSEDNENQWDIYRVETAGGGPPYNCGDQIINDEIPVEYAAEYWLYRQSE